MSIALRQQDFRRQCELAAGLGYTALEVAPFTWADDPLTLDGDAVAEYARIASGCGIAICGLHWLLVSPAGLSLVDADAAVRARTASALVRLVEIAADAGASYLVHGSPKQRSVPAGMAPEIARAHAHAALVPATRRAAELGLRYCIEPLARAETDFLNTVADAAEFAAAFDNPACMTMIDCSAAGRTEREPVPALIRRWLPTGCIGHVQLNDPNRKAPGQGEMDFGPVLQALHETGYDGWVAVEPFDYDPDGPGCAAYAASYLRGLFPLIKE
ncbi:MAG: sugar phosphate isomerase/epimerase family protein [Lautropia sp.]